MCKTPKAPKVEIPDPVILRNPFLDADRSKNSLISSLRTGRSALRIPLGSGTNLFSDRGTGSQPGGTAGARGNSTGRAGRGGTNRSGSGGVNSTYIPRRPGTHIP